MIQTNFHHLPKPIINALSRNKDPRRSRRISVTMLVDSPRIGVLKLRHWAEISEDFSERLLAFLGDAVHFFLEKSKGESDQVEERLIVDVDNLTAYLLEPGQNFNEVAGRRYISGRPDLYNREKKSVHDYKVTSVQTLIYGNGEIRAEWERQVNVNAWMYRLLGLEVLSGEVNVILRDWKKAEAGRNPNYPQIPFVNLNVPIWSMERQENYVLRAVDIFLKSSALKDADLPPCNDADRWRRPDKFAVHVQGQRRAVRVYETRTEADEHARRIITRRGRVEPRPGADVRCIEYCPVSKFCNYYLRNVSPLLTEGLSC